MDDLFRGGSAVLLYFVALRGEPAGAPRSGSGADRPHRGDAQAMAPACPARRELASLDDYLLHDIGLVAVASPVRAASPSGGLEVEFAFLDCRRMFVYEDSVLGGGPQQSCLSGTLGGGADTLETEPS